MSNLKTLSERIIAFEAVMRTGSLSGAARDLGLAQPTVRRTIQALETELSDTLFTRSDNGLIPTERARNLWPTAKAVVETSYAFYRAAASDPELISGTIRVSASRVVAHYVLPNVIARLQQQTKLNIEVLPDDRPADLLRRDADVAVRHTQPKQLQLVAKKVAPIELGLFSNTSVGSKDILSCLQTQPFVWEDRGTMLTDAAHRLNLPKPSNIVAATDDQALQIALISAGVGMGICQVPIAQSLGLHRVAAEWGSKLPVWIVAHEDQVNSPPVRKAFDFLTGVFDRS